MCIDKFAIVSVVESLEGAQRRIHAANDSVCTTPPETQRPKPDILCAGSKFHFSPSRALRAVLSGFETRSARIISPKRKMAENYASGKGAEERLFAGQSKIVDGVLVEFPFG